MSYGLVRTPDGRFRERLRPAVAEQLGMGQLRFRAEWREVVCPVLAIYASQDETWSTPEDASPELREAAAAYARRLDRERKQRYIDRARREMPDIRVLELPNTSHYCFLDREDAVVEAMRRFL
jgi:pimeloyl-ACP methyl ester carboxylesterase